MVSTLSAADETCQRNEIFDTFSVRETANKICEAKYERVALQFPDCYLKLAPLVYSSLCELLEPTTLLFILGDTSYGACCADEVGALHLNADAIVHYGQACLSPTRTLPVLHVFPYQPKYAHGTDRSSITSAIRIISSKEPTVSRILIMYDVALTESIASLTIDLSCEDKRKSIEVARPLYSKLGEFIQPVSEDELTAESKNDMDKCGTLQFCSEPPLNMTAILWISERQDSVAEFSSIAMRNAALQFANGMAGSCRKMYSLVLGEAITEEVDAGRLFRRRAGILSRVEQAQRIGVVAGTLAISGANEAIERTVGIIEKSGKRAYVILVGKVTPPKLLNFEEVEAFVFVTCPYRSLFTSKEVPVPIVTPFELEAALCNSSGIYGVTYNVGFGQCARRNETNSDSSCEERSVFVRSKFDISVVDAGSAASFHKSRKWKGLIENKGGTSESVPVELLSTEILEGNSGLALRYQRFEDS